MNKRRWETLLLTGLLLIPLAACGRKDPGGVSSSQPGGTSSSGSGEPSVSVIAPVEDPWNGPVNPLTGEQAEEELSARRPYAVMFNNLRKALPQIGVSRADVIYEIVAEGGITRMMAVFQDLEGVGDMGSIRSARDYYASIASGHDAIYVHAGGSPQAYQAFSDLKMSNIDFVNGPYYNMCWRDPERRKTAGLEHSLLTSSEKILEYLPQKFAREHDGDYKVGWTFSEDPPAGGEEASRLTVPFSKYKTGSFTYDPETGLYRIDQHIDGKDLPYTDGEAQVSVRSVLVLYTDVNRIKGDSAGRMEVRTTGTGDGLLLRDGQLYKITWQRDSEMVCYSFLDPSGQPIPLAVGPSYVNIVSTDAQVEWE